MDWNWIVSRFAWIVRVDGETGGAWIEKNRAPLLGWGIDNGDGDGNT